MKPGVNDTPESNLKAKALFLSVAFPFDRSFKLFSEEDQRAHLALFSHVPLNPEIEVVPLDRELNMTTRRVDVLCLVRDGEGECIHHQEVVSRYDNRKLDDQYWYNHLIVEKYRLPVVSSIILLTEAGVPETLSPNLKVKYGKFNGVCLFCDDRRGLADEA